MGEAFVRKEIENAMRIMPACYHSHQEMAKPGTIPDELAFEMYCYSIKTANPNNVDHQMFLGSYEIERETITITADLLHYPVKFNENLKEPEYVGGWFLNGGTEAIIQACWIYRNKYFYEKFGNPERSKLKVPDFMKKKTGLFKDLFSIRKNGWFSMYPEYSKLYGQHEKVPIPKILAPFDVHFALTKAADILGFGQENIEYFFLDDNGRPDPESIRLHAKKILDNGDDIAMVWIVVGDTERGIISDTEALDNAVWDAIKSKNDYRPPTIVDAAAQYLFAVVMDGSDKYTDANGEKKRIPNWDFRVKNVKAIVADPHKNQIPYPASILLIRDPQDTKHTVMADAYLSLDLLAKSQDMSPVELELTQKNATIPTSRAGYGAIATWAYYVGHGLKEIRKKKEKIWYLVMKLRNSIVEGELQGVYELVCEPDSALVDFRISPRWIEENEHELVEDIEIEKEIYNLYEKIHKNIPHSLILSLKAGKASYKIYNCINESTSDWLYIARSEHLTVKKEEEYKDFIRKKNELRYLNDERKEQKKDPLKNIIYDYLGLMAHIMEHNREKDIDLLVKRLMEEAQNLIK